MVLSQLLLELTDKIGLDQTDERLKPLLGSSLEIDDAIAQEITGKLLTVDAAKNNRDIKNHFFAQAYNGIDAEIAARVDEIGDDDFKAKISGIRGTGDKNKALLEKYKEIASKEPAGSDSKELKEKLKQLNEEVVKYKTEYIPKSELDNVLTGIENERLQTIEKTAFLGKNWSENFTADVRYDLAKIKLNQELEKIGAKMVRDGNSVKLVSKENPEMDLYENNKLVTFDSVVNQIMVDNKFLAVSQPNNSQQQQFHSSAGPQSQNTISPAIQKALSKSRRDQGIQ